MRRQLRRHGYLSSGERGKRGDEAAETLPELRYVPRGNGGRVICLFTIDVIPFHKHYLHIEMLWMQETCVLLSVPLAE